MRRTRRRDTPAEVAIRKELYRRGLRYRVDVPIPGVTRSRPDIVFTGKRVAIFVDGCFWHSCPEHGTLPTANREWWEEKLAANVERDRRHNAELEAAGWVVLRFWEHEDPVEVASIIASVFHSRKPR